MANYIKVVPAVAIQLGVSAIRNKTADGNFLLWHADLNSIPGNSLEERASRVGGVVLTPNTAKIEIDGTDNAIEVNNPYEPEIEPELPSESITKETETEITNDIKETNDESGE